MKIIFNIALSLLLGIVVFTLLNAFYYRGYNKGKYETSIQYDSLLKVYTMKFDSIKEVLDSNYILTPKDYRKLVKSKIR